MKTCLFCLSLLLGSSAFADELADANALFARKAYPQALQLYTKLANAGNVEAQRHLGEMYWYGEAGAIDNAKADTWFRKAAAKGDKVAVAALDVMQQRQARRADIDYWMSKYDGADLKSGQFRCPAPRIPAISKLNDEIKRVTEAMQGWQDCYNAFVVNLNNNAPLTKRMPADIAKLMNEAEMTQATAYLTDLHQRLAEDARISAKLVLADFGVWRDATEAYIAEHNEIVKSAPSDDRQRDGAARK
ncbi:MAG TPA: sel1 repeat family protein [Telluria sp.]|nr:sel1 repeat family protein [Telluria sp.]